MLKNYGIKELLRMFANGGAGQGSYYTPIMIQSIFIVPLIYFVIKRYDFFGTVLCFLFTMIWEFVQYSWGMDESSYTLIIFRYVSIISFGCFIAVGKARLNRIVLILLFVVGFVWQTILNYIPLHPIFMNVSWARTNYISTLFIVPFMYLVIRNYLDREIKITILKELGKASYNIYLVQMMFYGCGPAIIIYKLIKNALLQFVLCITLCLAIGYIFYLVESVITRRIVNKVKNKNCYVDKFEGISNLCNNVVNKR